VCNFRSYREFRLVSKDVAHCEPPIWSPGAIQSQFGGATSSDDYKRPEGSTPGVRNAGNFKSFSQFLHIVRLRWTS
jgi:hypothetical protein